MYLLLFIIYIIVTFPPINCDQSIIDNLIHRLIIIDFVGTSVSSIVTI